MVKQGVLPPTNVLEIAKQIPRICELNGEPEGPARTLKDPTNILQRPRNKLAKLLSRSNLKKTRSEP